MIIDRETCIGCGECVFTCTVGAIREEEGAAVIDRERCVECGNCLRIAPCPTGALQQDELTWPRIVRKYFSDNQQPWPDDLKFSTGYGRGTDECKTNDRSGRFRRGQVGVMIEVGRPGVSASFRDVEKMLQILLMAGVEFEEKTPLTALIADREKGLLREEIREERVLSCIIEAKIGIADVEKTLALIRQAAAEIDTVFSLGLVTRLEEGPRSPLEPVFARMGIQPRPNAKINLGLGKPIAEP